MRLVGEKLRQNIKDRAEFITGRSELTAAEKARARRAGERVGREIGEAVGRDLRELGKKLKKKKT